MNYFINMGTIKNILIIGAAIFLGIDSTQAGYPIKRNFIKGEVRTYQITYKIDSKSETSYETGFLTEKILEANPDGDTKIQYLYTLKDLIQKGKKLEVKLLENKDHIALDKNHQITNLYFGNTMLPYYLNILHEGILSEIPALNHSWVGYILDNNFQFEAKPVLPSSRNFTLRYTLKDVIPFEDETHNYRIDWKGISENLYFYTGRLYETSSRRKGSLLLGSDSFPLEMTFQLPSKIPGFTLSEFISVDETPIILEVELIEKGTFKEDDLKEEIVDIKQENSSTVSNTETVVSKIELKDTSKDDASIVQSLEKKFTLNEVNTNSKKRNKKVDN